MRKLKLFFACLLMAVLSIGQMWGADPVTVKSTFTKATEPANDQVTDLKNVVTWDITTGEAVGSPTVGTGKYSGTESLLFGSSGSNYFKTYTLSTDYFKDYNVTSVKIYVRNNGSKKGTLTATQGSVNIGSVTHSANTSDWGNLTVNTNTGEGGTLSVSYSVAQASYLSYIEVTYEAGSTPPPSCTSEITITKGDNPANGTFVIDNSGTVCIDEGNATVNVTATPNAGYHLATVTSTVGTVGDIDGNNCAITNISANTTINVTFAANPKYTVSFNVGGSSASQADITEESAGAGITLPVGPTPTCSADGWEFAGWKETSPVAEQTTTAPTLLAAGANYKPAANCTLYAVYKKTEGGDGAAVGTTMWSENFTGAGNKTTPTSPTSNGSVVYGSATVTYTWTDGATTSQVYLDTSGPHTDANNDNALISKTDGYLTISGIPTGKASTLTLSYATAGQGTIGASTNTANVSISGSTITIEDAEVTAFDLVFTNTHASKNIRLDDISVVVTTTTAAGTTYYLSAPTCCTPHAINIASPIANGGVTADKASACEDAIVTLTFTPAGGYHLDSWSVNGTAQDVAENTFTMPDEAVTVSATFVHDDCTNLLAPTLDGVTKTYNSATIAWNEVADAEEYAVSVVNHATSESVFAGNVDALSKALADLEPETQYDYSIMAVGDGTIKCADGNGLLESNFTTNPLPQVQLWLIEKQGETAKNGGTHALGVEFDIPASTLECSKVFRGWTTEAYKDYTHATDAPAVLMNKYTFESETAVTLYAVYADETPGASTTKTDELDYAFTGLTGTSYKPWSGKTGTSGAVYAGQSYALGSNPQSTFIQLRTNNSNSGVVTTGTGAGKVTKVTVAWNSDNGANGITLDVYGKNTAYTQATDLYGENSGTLLGSIVKGTSTELVITGSYTYIGMRSHSGSVYLDEIDVEWTEQGASTYSNYSTTCVAAPEAIVDPEEVNAPAAGVANGVIVAAYDNVNESAVAVALYSNAACTEAFTGSWLTASINDDKNIAYTIAENTTYAARTVYIKLTAPAAVTGPAAAEVVIPVSQEGKALVFSSLADLVAAELASGTEVTVSFSNVMITEVYETNAGYRYGLYLNVKDKDGENDIELFYNKQGDSEQVPDTWVKNGYVSATNLVTTWTEYKGQWELAMQGATWSWENGDITYGAPKAVSSVVVSGEPNKKAYVDGEKFNPAGLTVTVNYTVGDPEVIDAADADWVYETSDVMALNQTSINVKATYNTVTSENFYEVTDLTVNPISNKTIAQFIADEGGRCYLEGIVSGNINTTYGNFDLQDETGTIYVYGSDVFEDHGVAQGDKVKVIAEEYLLYKKQGNPDKDEALNVVFVSKISPVAITITSASTVEKGKTLNLTATTVPAAGAEHISYSIKTGSESYVSLSDKVLTGVEIGEATIIASVPDGEGYIANSVEFTVEVIAAVVHGSITYEENGGSEVEDVADATNLPDPLPTTTKDGFIFDGWFTTSTFDENTEAVAGEALTGDITLYAKWHEIPPYALVYTNNVAVVHDGESGVDDGTITISEKAYKLVKAGSGKKTGTIVVTVPAGATDLHFHAFAWGGKTAKIAIAGVTNPSISEFDLAGESGAAGEGNDFTLNGIPVDQYFHVSFDAVANTTEIEFSKVDGSADNRFFFYGVNQEGGDFGSYQRPTTSGNYGTICLPYAGTISGATLLDIAYFDGAMIYCDEVNGVALKAGKPYIFYATSNSLNVAYTANIETAAGEANGLHGFYNLSNMATDAADKKDLDEDQGNYILYNNQYWLVSGRAAYINNFRAYIKLDEISTTAPDPVPGAAPRRRVAMTVNGEQTATGVDELNASETPVKMIIDGQLFIIRGEKMYNANGQLVK